MEGGARLASHVSTPSPAYFSLSFRLLKVDYLQLQVAALDLSLSLEQNIERDAHLSECQSQYAVMLASTVQILLFEGEPPGFELLMKQDYREIGSVSVINIISFPRLIKFATNLSSFLKEVITL